MMDAKKLLIVAALGLAVFLIIRKKNAVTLPPDDNVQPENSGKTDGVVTTVDLGSLSSQMVDADRDLIRAGEDTTWNNFVSQSETR